MRVPLPEATGAETTGGWAPGIRSQIRLLVQLHLASGAQGEPPDAGHGGEHPEGGCRLGDLAGAVGHAPTLPGPPRSHLFLPIFFRFSYPLLGFPLGASRTLGTCTETPSAPAVLIADAAAPTGRSSPCWPTPRSTPLHHRVSRLAPIRRSRASYPTASRASVPGPPSIVPDRSHRPSADRRVAAVHSTSTTWRAPVRARTCPRPSWSVGSPSTSPPSMPSSPSRRVAPLRTRPLCASADRPLARPRTATVLQRAPTGGSERGVRSDRGYPQIGARPGRPPMSTSIGARLRGSAGYMFLRTPDSFQHRMLRALGKEM